MSVLVFVSDLVSVSVSELVSISASQKKNLVNQCLEFVSVLVSVSDLVSVSVSLSKPHFVEGRIS